METSGIKTHISDMAEITGDQNDLPLVKTMNSNKILSMTRTSSNQNQLPLGTDMNNSNTTPLSVITDMNSEQNPLSETSSDQNQLSPLMELKNYRNPLQVLMEMHSAKNLMKPRYVCKECSKVCSSRSEYIVHQTRHSGKIYQCHLCDKKYCFMEVLFEHWKKKHNFSILGVVNCCDGGKNCGCSLEPYKLDPLFYPLALVCGDYKIYNCQICPEVTKSEWDFFVHMKKHVGDEPFLCEICVMPFSDMPKLERHVAATHINAKIFTCPICFKSFKNKLLIFRHRATVHAEHEIIECEQCSNFFASRKDLMSHGCAGY